MSSGAGAGVTFLGTGAGVKKSDSDHLWFRWHEPLMVLILGRQLRLNEWAANNIFSG